MTLKEELGMIRKKTLKVQGKNALRKIPVAVKMIAVS